MRTFLVVILILTTVLLAYTSEPAPIPQAGNDAASQTAAAAVPAAQPPTEMQTAAATPPQPAPTATTSTSTTVLRVTVSHIPSNLPTYDRVHWKHRTDADGDCDCQDARQEMLVAESRNALSFKTNRKCRVTSSQWLAPYTNTVVTDPGKLDIDHMVPLQNAHRSSA